MKTIYAIFVLTFFAIAPVFAQSENTTTCTQSLFSNGSRLTGWYVGFSSSYSELYGQYTYLPGFSAGVVLNRNFKAGFFGKSFSCHETYLKFDDLLEEPAYLIGGYGGVLLEASPLEQKLIHVTFPFYLGAGGAAYYSQTRYPGLEDDLEFDYSRKHLYSSPYWVFEPGASLELNVTGFMKVYAGYSHRWLFGMSLENTPRNAFNGGNFNVGIRFGKM